MTQFSAPTGSAQACCWSSSSRAPPRRWHRRTSPRSTTSAQVSAAWGGQGPVAYAALYAGLTLTPAPATALSVGAGLLFGVPGGIVVVMAGALPARAWRSGSPGRSGRPAVTRHGRHRLRRLDERCAGAAARRDRCPTDSAVPVRPAELRLRVSRVGPRHYLLGTAIGILPAATVLVTIGAYGSTPGSAPFVLALGGMAVLTVVGTITARRTADLGPPMTLTTAACPCP